MHLNADYVVPSADEVAEWVAATYELPDVQTSKVQRLAYPLLYSVRAAQAIYWMRIYSAGHPSLTRLEAQVQAVAGVHGSGACTARPVAAKNQRLVQVGDVGRERRYAVLFTHAPGRGLNRSNMGEVAAFGAAVARLHKAPERLVEGRLRKIDFDYLAAEPLHCLEHYPAAEAVIDEVRSVAQEMEPRLDVGIPMGLCHGDVHAQNANIDTDGSVTIFDFDELGHGPLAYDLACYWRKAILEHEDADAANVEWHAFLKGYETIRIVTDQERRAIPALATIRAIWVMAMPARYVEIWGNDWLADPTYFAAHLRMIRRFAAEARTAGCGCGRENALRSYAFAYEIDYKE